MNIEAGRSELCLEREETAETVVLQQWLFALVSPLHVGNPEFQLGAWEICGSASVGG